MDRNAITVQGAPMTRTPTPKGSRMTPAIRAHRVAMSQVSDTFPCALAVLCLVWTTLCFAVPVGPVVKAARYLGDDAAKLGAKVVGRTADDAARMAAREAAEHAASQYADDLAAHVASTAGRQADDLVRIGARNASARAATAYGDDLARQIAATSGRAPQSASTSRTVAVSGRALADWKTVTAVGIAVGTASLGHQVGDGFQTGLQTMAGNQPAAFSGIAEHTVSRLTVPITYGLTAVLVLWGAVKAWLLWRRRDGASRRRT